MTPIDPRFPPVTLDSDLRAVDAPQFLPSAPHNLPLNRDRPAQRGSAVLMNPSVPLPSSGTPIGLPAAPDLQTINDPHHYARVSEGNVSPGVSAGVNISMLVITEPVTRRNYLMLRNASTTSNLYISFGIAASLASPVLLAPGQIIFFDVVVPQNDVFVMADNADGVLCYAVSTVA